MTLRPGSSYLSRLDPRPKLLATLAFLVSVGLMTGGVESGSLYGPPPEQWTRLAALGALLAAALIPDGVWLRRAFWLRLLPVLGLGVSMALLVTLTKEGGASWTVAHLGGWRIRVHEAGLLHAADLGARTLLAASALVALSLRTSGPALLEALASLRVPRALLSVLGGVARSLWIVTDEARRMRRARLMRGAGATFAVRARATGAMIGSLLLRSLDRAERVERAMTARGFDGARIPQLHRGSLRPAQALVCLTFAALSLAAAVSPIP